MATINTASIVAKAKAAINKGAQDGEIRAQLKDKSLEAARELQAKLEIQFDKHPVTKELNGSNKNTSRFLSYGNIKAFFGISDSKADSDLTILRELLSHFNTKVTKTTGTAQYKVQISFPKVEEYYEATPPPEGAYKVSWLKALELGLLQNFANFLFRTRGFPSSKSGTGIEVKAHIHRGSLNTIPKIPYITQIYKMVLKNSDVVKSVISKIKVK